MVSGVLGDGMSDGVKECNLSKVLIFQIKKNQISDQVWDKKSLSNHV